MESSKSLLNERWQYLMQCLDMQPNLPTYTALINAYSAPQRHYHTTKHLGDCLKQLEQVRLLTTAPAEVELALWFHDAIYDPLAMDNELNSANWAKQFLVQNDARARGDLCNRVCDYIMATSHKTTHFTGDAMWVVDIDLSILGQPTTIYAQFEQDIRAEYQAVPLAIYRNKRSELLTKFLDRPFIYATDYFRERYETQARINLQTAI